jgi:hypothetical protein
MCETVMVIVEEYVPGWNSTGILRVSEALWEAIREGEMTRYWFLLAVVDTMLCVERTQSVGGKGRGLLDTDSHEC